MTINVHRVLIFYLLNGLIKMLIRPVYQFKKMMNVENDESDTRPIIIIDEFLTFPLEDDRSLH